MRNIDDIEEIAGAQLIEYLKLSNDMNRTGKTEHVIHGKEETDFYGLAICQYDGEEEYYLFYCDQNWKEIDDGFHETIEEAKRQASFEYNGLEGMWIKNNAHNIE